MTARPLVRYTGPKRAYVGAIGTLVGASAVEVNGRTVHGLSAPCDYQVRCGDVLCSTWATWPAAVAAMALECGDAAFTLDAAPTPAGLEVIAGDDVWRLVPV